MIVFRNRLILSAGLLLAAVAHGQPSSRVQITLPSMRQAILIDTIAFVTEFDAPMVKVWSAAARVFYDYKIPTDLRDSVAGTVGTTKYIKSSSMFGFAMSQLLNCGTSITGPNADNFRITSALVALVSVSGPTKTKLGVGLAAVGLDMRGNSADAVMCGTTGRLEGDFAERVRKILRDAP